jgi:aspartyl aminopeptidase
MQQLSQFLQNSLTAYHAVDNARALLEQNGFLQLLETEDWTLAEGGKYYVVRGGSSIIAFTVGSLDEFAFKIVASHTDSPALKIKENPLVKNGVYQKLNVETYGGGIWYSFFDRPLKIAGRVVVKDGNALISKTVQSSHNVTIPSVAVHMNREVNSNFSVNAQVDLQPLIGLGDEVQNFLSDVCDQDVVSYDLFVVNASQPYEFGLGGEFLASPRIDNLTSVYASLEALTSGEECSGICVAACLDNEEVGSTTPEGADSDFLQKALRRIAYALHFDEEEYCKALACSYLLSLDNAHAVHPNHPEKADITNKAVMGGGIVIKNHANKAYTTNAMSSAILKTILGKNGVKYQAFFNRSDVRSGSTLGTAALRYTGMLGADIGLPQLAMHSACESFAKADYTAMEKALTAFYKATLTPTDEGLSVE